MAKDTKSAGDQGDSAPRKSKKLLIIIVAAVFLLAVIGGGAFILLKKSDDHDDEDATESAPTKKKDKKGKESHPVFLNMDPFTVNLVPETGDQYLQVNLSVELEDPTAEIAVKAHMPKIRNNVTLLLSSKKASELLSKEGKQKLAGELKDTINEVLDPAKKKDSGKGVEGPAKEVLFTSFIIQ